MHSSHLAVKGGALLFKQIQSKAEIRGGDFTRLKICLLYRYVGMSHIKVVWESLFKSWYELQVLHIMQLLKWIRKKLNQPSILWALKCFVFHHYNIIWCICSETHCGVFLLKRKSPHQTFILLYKIVHCIYLPVRMKLQ